MKMAVLFIYTNIFITETQMGDGAQSNPDMDGFNNKLNLISLFFLTIM